MGVLRHRFAVPLVLLATLPAAPERASAQSQPFVAPAPGTVITTNTGASHEIDSVDGSTIRALTNLQPPLPWLAACRPVAANVEFDSQVIDGLWPLQPGKTLRSETRRGSTRWRLVFRIGSSETVTVGAGTFPTWPIEVEETTASNDYKALYRCWYAPSVGFMVKREHTVLVGSAPNQGFEAERIERRDRSQFRAPPSGTSFETSLGIFRIDGAEGTNLVRRSDQAGLDTTWVGGLVGYNSTDAILEAAKRDFARLWPLSLGKSVRFDIRRADGAAWNNVLTVERAELTRVPAGTYSTFVIAHRERAANGSYDAEYLYWWSPALGFPIKREARSAAGVNAPPDYELRAVKPPS